MGERAGDDLARGDAVGGGAPARHEAVREGVGGEVLDVLGERVVAAVERGASLGGGGERQRAAGGDGVLDEAVEGGARGLAAGDDEADDEILARGGEVDAVGRGPGGVDGRGAEAGVGGGGRLAGLGFDELEDGALGLRAWQREGDVEEEAVARGLGEGAGALVLYRVLGGHDH
jgi:hypothetical protein